MAKVIRTNAVGVDLRRGLMADGIIKRPTQSFSQTVKILIDNQVPDGVWVMNQNTRQGLEFMVRGLKGTVK